MRCNEFMEMLDALIDGELDAEQRARMLEHAEKCEACGLEYKKALALNALLRDLDAHPTVPLAAQAAWRGAVRREAQKRRLRQFYRAAGSIAAALLVLVGGTFAMRNTGMLRGADAPVAVSASNGSDASIRYVAGMPDGYASVKTIQAALETDGEAEADEVFAAEEGDMSLYAVAEDGAMPESAPITGAANAIPDMGTPENGNALLTRSATREIYTDSFDAAHAQAGDLAEEYGGYLVRDMVTTRSGRRIAEMEAAIPRDDLDSFLTALDYIGDVARAEVVTEDVSQNYYDAQGRLETLRLERDRLNVLVAAAANAEEMAALNAQLEDVHSRIDALESEIRTFDGRMGYARVTVLLREGPRSEDESDDEDSVGARARRGFNGTLNSLKEFFADMAVSLAVLAPVAAIVLPILIVMIVVIVVVHRRRKS